jgi:hypothetical protein
MNKIPFGTFPPPESKRRCMECSGCGQAFGVSNWDRLFKFSYACPNCDVINGTYKEPAAYVFAAFILNCLGLFMTLRPIQAIKATVPWLIVLGVMIKIDTVSSPDWVAAFWFGVMCGYPILVNLVVISKHNGRLGTIQTSGGSVANLGLSLPGALSAMGESGKIQAAWVPGIITLAMGLNDHLHSPQSPLIDPTGARLTNLQAESLRQLSDALSEMPSANDEDENEEHWMEEEEWLESEEWQRIQLSARQAAMHFQDFRKPMPLGAHPS